MSFILDALRRADADRARERAGVPGLHDQAPPVITDALSGADDGTGAEGAVRPWRRLVPLALGLCSVAVAAWWLVPALRPAPPTEAVAAAPAQTAAAQPMLPVQPAPIASPPGAQQPAIGAMPTPPVANAGVQAAQQAPNVPSVPSVPSGPLPAAPRGAAQPTAPIPLPALLPDPPSRPQPRPDPNAPLLQPQLPGSSEPVPPAAEPSRNGAVAPERPAVTPPVRSPAAERKPSDPVDTAAAATIPLLRELPAALRRELPALSVNGAVHSPEPASRMLVLDGQVVREGHTVAGSAQPGLVLEQIGPKAALFSYKGQRFQVPY